MTLREPLAAERRAIEAFAAAPRPLLLRGAVRNYSWGGTRFIPELLGRSNDGDRPWAELWLGAHPRAPAEVRLEEGPEGWVGLDRLLRAAPAAVLGAAAARRFRGELPYLFKVLDAREPLSIQVHPARAQARAGFARENAAGLPQDSPERSYPDPNPKQEVHAALGELWMLHGFRPPAEVAELAARHPELDRTFGKRPGLRELYTRLMTLPQEAVDEILDPILARLEKQEPADKGSPDYWALRASRLHPLPGAHRDRGIFSIYLLNLLRLGPGQGTFQSPGLPHAYLAGTTIELMNNSDNVLRGGLTSKRIDVPELLRAVAFRAGKPSVIEPRAIAAEEGVYPSPARAFRLSRLELPPGRARHLGGRGPDCLLALEGTAVLECGRLRLELGRGQAALVPAGLACAARAGAAGRAVLYRASVP
jgi:mannose-6-phosphate isomerase